MKKAQLLLLSITLGHASAFAQQADSIASTVLNPVVVTGTGTYNRAKTSPMAVQVVTATELKNTHASSLQEALSKLTSSISTHTNGMGTYANFNGVSDEYILILENGRRISGDDRWNRISMNNIKRVEIFSGAASALYGSEAIAGVINIITEEVKNGTEASADTRVRDHGRMDQDIQIGVRAGKFSSHTTYNHRQADNWQVNHYQAFTEGNQEVLKLTGRPMSTGFRSENITQKMEWRWDDKWSAYVRGNYYDNTTLRPQNATYFTQKTSTNSATGEKTYTYTEAVAYKYDNHHQSYSYGAGARWTPNSRVHVYLDLNNDQFKSDYDYWQTSKQEAYAETRKKTRYTNETLKGIFRLADWNKLSAGMEFVQEGLKSESDNIHHEKTNTYNVFAQEELRLVSGLEAVAGMRYTYNDHFGSNLTPHAALLYRISDFSLRASYAEGYRTPTLSQLYATDQAKTASRYTIPNTELKAEKNNFWNINATYGNQWMNLSVSGFVNKIRNMINYRTLTTDEILNDQQLSALYDNGQGWSTIRQRDNIDRATLQGISTNAKFLLPWGLTIGGGYTWTDAKAQTQSLNKRTQQYETKETAVDKSVRHMGNLLVSWDHTWKTYHLNVSLNGHLQGKRYSSTYGYAAGYNQWDLHTKHTFQLRQFELEPGLGIENLFNERDHAPWNSNFSTTHPGRTYLLSMALRFRN